MSNAIRRKLVIVGDGACGKTSLLCSFALGEFPKEYQPTIFENYVAEIRLDGKPVQLALWDTAGQEEYERLRPLSYSKSHVILIAFAIDTPDSLENVTTKWIEEVREICGPTIPILLVGCKADLRPTSPTADPATFVSRAQAERVAQQIGARVYKECSALKIQGVDDVFEAATRLSMLMREGVPAHGGGGDGGDGGRHHRRKSSGMGMNGTGDAHPGKCCVIC
jgi:Rho family protein